MLNPCVSSHDPLTGGAVRVPVGVAQEASNRRGRTNAGVVPVIVGDEPRGSLPPVAYPQLREHVADVVGDGLPAQEQPLGDLRVGQAVGEHLQHIALAGG